MTSTNIHVGLSDNKNSSKVLRPPGGGHTDIFGVRGEDDIKTPLKQKRHGESSIGSLLFYNDNKTVAEETKIKTTISNENINPSTEDVADSKEIETPRKGRVPPGGFSSAFW